ncbi:hypothetical protein Cni_G02867 [Canna indica]|uniref:EMB514 n=1 Tax=Canna indica TaxID=4628 RepID=A0AAQ3Q2J9_9LILI|nr:hypothetical protein Cni_G02867 [Canna indica]
MAEVVPENVHLPEGDEIVAEEVPVETGGAPQKREIVEGDEEGGASKRQKVEESVKEEGVNGVEGKVEVEGDLEMGDSGKEKEPVTASVGPKVFTSSDEMFFYFLNLLRSWSPNLDINKYEHMALLDLIQKGHSEPAKKIGEGIEAFQVRYHPTFKSRCFFLVRVDGTSDDFSFRKCVDNILPLPDHMKKQPASNNSFDNKNGGGRRGGGRRGGRGYGRRGGFRK